MTTEPSLGQRLKERLRQQEIAEVFAREGIQGLKQRGLLAPTFGAPVPLSKGLKRVGTGLVATVGGAFTEEGARSFGNIVLGEGPKPSVRLPEGVKDIFRVATGGPFAGPKGGVAPEQLGVRGAVEAAAPIPLGGPIATAGVKLAMAGVRAAAPGVRAAARAAGPAAGRLAREQGGFLRTPGAGGRAHPEFSTLLNIEEDIKKAEAALKASRGARRLVAQENLDGLRQLRDDTLELELPPAEWKRYQDLQQQLSEDTAALKVMAEIKPVAAPKFGTVERATYDAARRQQGVVAGATGRRRTALKARLEATQRQIADIETGKTLPEATPENIRAAGLEPTEGQPGPAIQASMGIGERPAQGGLFENLRGEAQTVPLADAEQLALRQARAAEVARGQAELPLTTAAAPGKLPWQMTKEEHRDRMIASVQSFSPKLASAPEANLAADSLHAKVVARAFHEGKPVPPEVLADYPDLAGKVTPSAVAPAPGLLKPGIGRATKAVEKPVAPGGPLVAQAEAEARAKVEAARATFQAKAAAKPSAPAQPVTAPAAGAPPAQPPPPPVAQAAPPPPPEGFAANIRLVKYPEELRGEIKAWADAHPTEVQAARRGVRSDALVAEDARRLVEEMGGDFDRLQKRWKPGEAWNAEEITSIRGLLRQRTVSVMDAAQVARTSNTAENHTKLLLAMQEQARVQEIVHGVTAEAGRALRSFRQEAMEAFAANDVTRMEALLKRLSTIVGADRSKLDEIAAALMQLDINNPLEVNNFIRALQKPKMWDYVMELFINGILSGPKSHIINNLTNMGNTFLASGERATAAAVEQILAPLQSRKVERFFSEAPADLIGAISGIEEGARGAMYTLRNGITPGAASKYEFRRTAFRGNLGRIVRAPGTLLEAADTFSYAQNYRGALSAGIVRQTKKEGLKGQALINRQAELKLNPTAVLIASAQKTAEYRLFRQEAGKFTSDLLHFREQHPALRFVIPFIRTPVNIFKFGLERSPVGAFNPSLWRNLAAKNPEASEQIARVFIGSTLTALVALQFAKGKITGRAPDNAAERDRFYREGKLPYAVKIGDKWIQYQRIEPFNQVFSLVAAAVDAINAKDKTSKEKVEDAVVTMGQNLLSQTYMRGLADLMNAVTAPERYGTSWLGRFASGLVPFSAALRTGAQIADPTIRRPRTIPESLEAGLPGLSQRVPPALTAFGEEAQRQSPAFFPIAFSSAQQSAVDKALEEIDLEIGFVGNTIGGVELNREEQQEYQRLAGQITYSALVPIVESSGYRVLPLALKEDMLTRTRDNAREKARIMMRLRLAVKPREREAVMAGG